MMTYEQAVATAMLNVVRNEPYAKSFFLWGPGVNSSLAERTFALRRLRVRAGLVP